MTVGTLRTTTGVVDRVDPDGVVLLHEADTGRRGYVANTTPIEGVGAKVRPGTQLSLEVDDRGNIMVVTAARAKVG